MKTTYDREGMSREIRLISDAIINLYAAHVNSFLYPYDHPLVSDSLRNSYQCLQKCLEKKSVITLDPAENGIIVDGQMIGENILLFRNVAAWLTSNNITSLSFVDGLTRRELISFHKVISVKKQSAEDLPKAMLEKSVANITVRLNSSPPPTDSDFDLSMRIATKGLIKDYISNMFYTGEPEKHSESSPETIRNLMLGNTIDIAMADGNAVSAGPHSSPNALEGSSLDDSVCMNAIEQLFERDVSDGDRGLIRSIPPFQMAHFLNAMLFKSPDRGVVSRIVAAYFGENGAVSEEESRERAMTLFKGLKPALRGPFRVMIPLLRFEDLGQDSEEPAEQFREDAVLPKAPHDDSHEQILGPYSPFVQRMLSGCDFTFDFIVDGGAVFHDIELRGDITHLFHGGCPGNLCADAEEGQFSAETPDIKIMREESIAELIEECSGDIILDYSFDVILEILDSGALEPEALASLSRRLSALVELFVEKGEFEKVLDVFNALKSQALKTSGGSQAAAILKGIFSQDHLLTRIVTALRQYGRKKRVSAVMVTKALHSYLVPHLLDALSTEEETTKRRFIISLLISIRGDVLPHVLERLRDSRWYVLRNMLLLLRECHGRAHLGDVRDFLQHEVPLVQLEALRTLLKFHDPGAVPSVLKYLRTENETLQRGAALLAGSYRIKEAMPSLLKLLREKDRLGKNYLLKKSIVRSLGRIGNSKALPHLMHLCRSSSLIHKEQCEMIRAEIFKTLHNYPIASVKSFIDYGLGSEDKVVDSVCRKLMNRYKKSGEQ